MKKRERDREGGRKGGREIGRWKKGRWREREWRIMREKGRKRNIMYERER
jgi:hypothetical protein